MRTLTNSGMTVNAFDEACWLADTNILIVGLNSGIVADGVVLSETRGGDAIAVWSFFGRQTKLDVSELLRLKAYGTADGKVSGSMWLRLNSSDQDYDLQITYKTQGRSNPLKEWMVSREDGFQLLPSVIYKRGGADDIFRGPIYIPSGEAGTWALKGDVTGNVALAIGAVTNATITGNNNELTIVNTIDGAANVVQRVRLRPRACDEELVHVLWTSRTGGYKRVPMQRCKATVSQVNRVSLEDSVFFGGSAKLPINFYRGFAGESEEFTLRLEHLTAYDMWWYSDLLISDYVIVTDDSLSSPITKKVEVTTKSITIPDGSVSDATFEIKVKYRTGDAFNLY